MNTRMLIAVVVTMFMCQQVHAQTEDDPEQTEVTELEGTWEAVSIVAYGETIENDEKMVMRIESNRLRRRLGAAGEWESDETFSLNPTAMPAEIDIENPEMLGIYELDDGLLTMCICSDENFDPRFRPGRFESTNSYRTILIVFRRVQEESE